MVYSFRLLWFLLHKRGWTFCNGLSLGKERCPHHTYEQQLPLLHPAQESQSLAVLSSALCHAVPTIYDSCFPAPVLLTCKMHACFFNTLEDSPILRKPEPSPPILERPYLTCHSQLLHSPGSHCLHLILVNVNNGTENKIIMKIFNLSGKLALKTAL